MSWQGREGFCRAFRGNTALVIPWLRPRETETFRRVKARGSGPGPHGLTSSPDAKEVRIRSAGDKVLRTSRDRTVLKTRGNKADTEGASGGSGAGGGHSL